MGDILISIIIPVYNAADTINRTLNSVICNTYNIEVICVDDGSIDNSISAIKSIMQYDKRIRLIEQENMGASIARNTGLNAAKGKYIMFCDADDELEQGALDYIIDDLVLYDPEYLVFGRKTVYQDGHYDNWLKGEKEPIVIPCERVEYFNKIIEQRMHSVVVYNRVYKHSIITDNNIEFEKALILGEDILFNFVYFQHIKTVVEDGRAVYLQHKMEGSLTSQKRPDYFKENTKVIPFVIREMGLESNTIQPFTDRLYLKSADKAVLRALSKRDAMNYKEMIDIINEIKDDDFDCIYNRFNFELFPALKGRLALIKEKRIALYYIRYVLLPLIKKKGRSFIN